MKNTITTVLAIVLMSTMAFSQTIKVTGGVDLMNIKFSSNIPIIIPPDDLPTDNGPTDTAKSTAINKSFNNEVISSSANTTKNTTNETGFYLGVALSDISLSESLELMPEVRFVGVKDFNQIQVPVLLSYGITEKFHAFAGPNFAFLLDAGEGVKSFNFALDFGLYYDISKKIAIDARYDWGQTNLLDGGDSNNYIKINNIQFGIAYSFGK